MKKSESQVSRVVRVVFKIHENAQRHYGTVSSQRSGLEKRVRSLLSAETSRVVSMVDVHSTEILREASQFDETLSALQKLETL